MLRIADTGTRRGGDGRIVNRGLSVALGFAWLAVGSVALGHPGAGIVVDAQGDVIFTDTGGGIWKIDGHGQLTRMSKYAYHWIALDKDGAFSDTNHSLYRRLTPRGTKPALLIGDDRPIVIGRDGNMYHAACHYSGPLLVTRVEPGGDTFVLAQVPGNDYTTRICPVNGIAVAADGAVYFSEMQTVTKVSKEGAVAGVFGPITVPDCAAVPGVTEGLKPYLRGLDVGTDGSVYVAASGCGAVLKITSSGTITTILKADNPWSPTAVALGGNDLYVLEYLHTTGKNPRDWLPRVRKLAADGTVTILATVTRH
jgi:sugar lactone lactonase YvrE